MSKTNAVTVGWLCATLLVMLVAGLPGTAQAAVGAPDAIVRQESDALLALLQGGGDDYREDRSAFLEKVEGRLSQFVDFPGIARLVMGAHWKEADPAQRSRFAEVFRGGLVGTYTGALMAFTDVEVIVQGSRPGRSPKRASVNMQIRSGDGRSVPMMYSMALVEQGWRVRNVVIDGINLGLIYRNQFASAYESSGNLDTVIDEWSAEIASLAADEEVEAAGDSAPGNADEGAAGNDNQEAAAGAASGAEGNAS